MADQRRSSEDRQAELTDAALHIIATQGIAALTTRSLAARVGLSTGAIFKHFASLDALLDAVVTRVEEVLDLTYPSPTLSPIARLEQFVDARSVAVGQQLGILRLVLSEQFLLALPMSGSERLAACVQKTRAFVTECLREAQSASEIRTDLSAETLAPIVMGAVQMLALSSSKTRANQTQSREVQRALFALLRVPPQVSEPKRKSSR
ncbi:MAG: TetR/AcrR family transcriptional regulator [Deltaproteobacteria bacterium]|nr:TetR/AcrR family transcriptional regulator [Deltaproteobacteria bacterium]